MTRLCQRFHDSHAIESKKALRQSHDDAKQYREEAIKRLQAEYNRPQNRLNAMYLDKLDGRIAAEVFDLRASEWRTEQRRLHKSMEEHQAADQTCFEKKVRLLELSQKAHTPFLKQRPREK